MNLADHVNGLLTFYLERVALLPIRLEVAVDVAASLYHFRPDAANGVNVVIDPDLLPGRCMAYYVAPEEDTKCTTLHQASSTAGL